MDTEEKKEFCVSIDEDTKNKNKKRVYSNIFEFILDLDKYHYLNIVIGLNILSQEDISRFSSISFPIHLGWDRYSYEEKDKIKNKKNPFHVLDQNFNEDLKSLHINENVVYSFSNRIDNIIFDYSTTKNLTNLSCLSLLYPFFKKGGSIYIPFSTNKPFTVCQDKTILHAYLFGWEIEIYISNKKILSEIFPDSLVEVYNFVPHDLQLLTKEGGHLFTKMLKVGDNIDQYKGYLPYPIVHNDIFKYFGPYYKITRLI